MNSDEVNSIDDTVESRDIALLLRDVYYDVAVELNLDAHESLFELEDSGDADQPVLMYLPENVSKVYWIKYNNQLTGETNSSYIPVSHKDFDEFYTMQNGLSQNTTDVDEMTFVMNEEDFEIMYATDRMPRFFTHVGNTTILFDSLDEAEDTTLQKEKTMCAGLVYPTFTLENDFIPILDASQFPYYRNRAKVRAFAEQKQVENKEAASETRNQKVLMQKRKSRIHEGPALKLLQARYGRC